MNKKDENLRGLGKIPPQAIEEEMAVLGALIQDKDAIISVSGILVPDSFYKDQHKLVFEAILELFNTSEAIDLLTVTNKLRKQGNLEKVGGAYFITQLTETVSSSANIEYHARIISEQYMRRNLIRLSHIISEGSWRDDTDIFELLDQASSGLMDIDQSVNQVKSNRVRDILPEVVEEIKNAKKLQGLIGVPSGYRELDKLTGGWKDTFLIIIAARPAMGKTECVINLSVNAALTGKKIALFSLEMTGTQLVKRIVTVVTEIFRDKIKSGNLTDEDWSRITKINEKVLDNILIQDNPSINTMQFRSICKKLKMKQNIDLIGLDYLQLMSGVKKVDSKVNEVGEISRTLKLVAMELKIPVVALSQLNRDVEKRGGDKRPQLSDLRESGSIEQDADMVIFPYRPIYYGIEVDDEGNSTKNLMLLDIAKHRDGALDQVKLKYYETTGKISDKDTNHEPPEPYRPDKFTSSGKDDFDIAPF